MSSNEKDRFNALINREGVFGFGLSNNNNLDLLNLVVLACAGIIIKIFFQANVTVHGGVGPASTTIWGYGMTAFALFIMTFMSFYMNNKNQDFIEKRNKNYGISVDDNFFTLLVKFILNDSIPIFLTFCILLYVIYINFVNFNRINKGYVSDSYYTYSFYSSLLIIIQITLIIKYMYNSLNFLNAKNRDESILKQTLLIKSASYILSIINFVFVMILHILLSFYSTDG